jgi:hypothetical protein
VAGICGYKAQCLGGCVEKYGIHEALVEKSYRSYLFGHGKDDMEIGSIEQLGLSIFYPLSSSK